MITTRDAVSSDAPALARLSGQLGYPATQREVADRLSRVTDPSQARVIVAVDESREVIAWTTVRTVEHIHSEEHAEISGFVVDENKRGRGVGRLLMAETERWARERHLPYIRLNANVTRTGAHRFYQSLGFTKAKQSYVFKKELEAPSAAT